MFNDICDGGLWCETEYQGYSISVPTESLRKYNDGRATPIDYKDEDDDDNYLDHNKRMRGSIKNLLLTSSLHTIIIKINKKTP